MPKGPAGVDVRLDQLEFGEAPLVDQHPKADASQIRLQIARVDAATGGVVPGIKLKTTSSLSGELPWVQLLDGIVTWAQRQGGVPFVREMTGLDRVYPSTMESVFTDRPSPYTHSSPGFLWNPLDPTSSRDAA